MSAIEKAILLGVTEKRLLPKPKKYPLVDWIVKNKNKYRFVYATGGKKPDTLYVLEQLGLINYFDLENSIDKTNYRFSKKTGLPFKKIKAKFPDCFVITDSESDCNGARLAGIKYIKIEPGQRFFNL